MMPNALDPLRHKAHRGVPARVRKAKRGPKNKLKRRNGQSHSTPRLLDQAKRKTQRW